LLRWFNIIRETLGPLLQKRNKRCVTVKSSSVRKLKRLRLLGSRRRRLKKSELKYTNTEVP
jgi:hypothetical protein